MAPASTKFLKLDDRISCDLHVSYSSNANSGRIEASDSEGSRRSPRGQASPPPGNDSDWAWHHQRPRRRGAAREKNRARKIRGGRRFAERDLSSPASDAEEILSSAGASSSKASSTMYYPNSRPAMFSSRVPTRSTPVARREFYWRRVEEAPWVVYWGLSWRGV